MFKRQMTSIAHDDEWNDLGTGRATKMDEFSEKFQTAFDLPPHIGKIMSQICFEKRSKNAPYKGPKSATFIFIGPESDHWQCLSPYLIFVTSLRARLVQIFFGRCKFLQI